jgi:hypothetical protein
VFLNSSSSSSSGKGCGSTGADSSSSSSMSGRRGDSCRQPTTALTPLDPAAAERHALNPNRHLSALQPHRQPRHSSSSSSSGSRSTALAQQMPTSCSAEASITTPTSSSSSSSSSGRGPLLLPLPLSFDHTPSRPDEAARVLGAGGSVSAKVAGGKPRVGGELEVSRSFGDVGYVDQVGVWDTDVAIRACKKGVGVCADTKL